MKASELAHTMLDLTSGIQELTHETRVALTTLFSPTTKNNEQASAEWDTHEAMVEYILYSTLSALFKKKFVKSGSKSIGYIARCDTTVLVIVVSIVGFEEVLYEPES